jgi:hypothetical protein
VGVLGDLFADTVRLEPHRASDVVDEQRPGDHHAEVDEGGQHVAVGGAVAAEVADQQDAAQPDRDPPRVLQRGEGVGPLSESNIFM